VFDIAKQRDYLLVSALLRKAFCRAENEFLNIIQMNVSFKGWHEMK
jgi:hypothetical protein